MQVFTNSWLVDGLIRDQEPQTTLTSSTLQHSPHFRPLSPKVGVYYLVSSGPPVQPQVLGSGYRAGSRLVRMQGRLRGPCSHLATGQYAGPGGGGGGGHCLFEGRYQKQTYKPLILCYHCPL